MAFYQGKTWSIARLVPLGILLATAAGCSGCSGCSGSMPMPSNHNPPDASASLAPTTAPSNRPSATASSAPTAPAPDDFPIQPVKPVGDLTANAARSFVLPPDAAAPALATTVVDYSNPSAVAAGYVQTRLTHRFDDPAGYIAAVTAPAYTTLAFAQRSAPTAAEASRIAVAQQAGTIKIGKAGVSDEAPATPSTSYVTVACTVTTTYRGGDTTPADWTLRLVLANGQWRVDGVLSTD